MKAGLFLAALLVAGGAGCNSSRSSVDTTRASTNAVKEVRVGSYGIGCRTFQAPDIVGPPSYSIRDLGKPGVPVLSLPERKLLVSIGRYVGTEHLRFAILQGDPSFVVFDASMGACADFAPGYRILNTRDPNEYYEPGEAPGDVHGGPAGGFMPTPGPWMSP